MTLVLKELKAALKDRISNKDWLDDSTKKNALDKADTINEFLAYPSEIKNSAFLDKFYSRVSKHITTCSPFVWVVQSKKKKKKKG